VDISLLLVKHAQKILIKCLKDAKCNTCVKSYKNILPNISIQFRLKSIYGEVINVPNITRCEFLYRCNVVV